LSEEIKIKKSTYYTIVILAIMLLGMATFFGGYFIANLESSESITKSDLEDFISKIEITANSKQQSGSATSEPQGILSISKDDDPIKGNPDAPVTIIEFSDFQCPFCSRFFDQTLPQIQKEYIDTGKVNFVYRDFPIDNLHPNARPAHIAAECADEEGKFWEYHDLLFERQKQWSGLSSINVNDKFEQFASDIELNFDAFDSCLGSAYFADEVNKDYLDGITYGVTGTPTFFIGNEKEGYMEVSGAQPFAVFKQSIDRQLESLK